MIMDLLLSVITGLLAGVQALLSGAGSLLNVTHLADAIAWAMQFDAIVPVSDALGVLSAVAALVAVMLGVKLTMWVIQIIRG